MASERSRTSPSAPRAKDDAPQQPVPGFADVAATPAEEGTIWQLIILLAGSSYAPLQVWVNSAERAGILQFALIGAIVFSFALLCRVILVRLGMDRLGATYAVAVFILCVSNAGVLLDRPLGRIPLVVACALTATIVYRLRLMRVFRLTMAWGAIALLAYPATLSVIEANGGDRVAGAVPADPVAADLAVDPRDVLIVVADGYASSSVLSSLYGFDNDEVLAALRTNGFDINSDVVANYGHTRFSVASVLQMGYVTGPMSVFPRLDPTQLLDVIGGGSVVARWFQEAGYRHVYVESGWFGTRCDERVDVCVDGPWPDESVYDVVHRSLMRNLPGFETGTSFSMGAQHVMAWLRNDLDDYLSNGVPDFIYVHLLAPHPPLFLRPDCEMRAEDGVEGFTISQQGMTDSELTDARNWYVGQLECVNSVLEHVGAIVEATDAIALIFGDHGPDSLGQLFRPGAEWDAAQRRERLTTIVAARVPGCSMSRIVSLVNVSRRLLSCISSGDFPDLGTKTYDVEQSDTGLTMVEIEAPSIRPNS